MIFLGIITVDIGTFDGKQNNFWNKWYHVSLTSNISGKTWSNCTRVLKLSGLADSKSVPSFENLKICGIN